MDMVTDNNKSASDPKTQTMQTGFESLVRAHGEEIFKRMETQTQSIFNKDWWYGRIMEWSMKNEQFKTQMFRFVDVLPYLNSSSEVSKHLKEYFAEGGDSLPPIFNIGVGMGSLAPSLMAGAIRKNITQMAKMFITGESPKDALPHLTKARKDNIAFTVDLLGEATLSEKEALDYQSRYIELINWLSKDAETWEHNPILDEDERGKIPQVNISVKVTSLYSQVNIKAWDDTVRVLKERLRPIFQLAKERFVFLNIDMEQFHHKDLTLQVFEEMLLEPEFKDYPHFGIVIQAYLRDSLKDIQRLTDFAKHRGTPITVRLVKGAYWDYEVIEAQQKGWKIPVYTNKKESDHNYEICARFMLENHQHIRLAVGSHNVRSIAAALVIAESLGLPKNAVELQMLYGMAEPIKKALIEMGYRVREYATVGELIPGMAYLVRRLLENTSNESFLRSKFADNKSIDVLLEDPSKNLQPSTGEPQYKEGEYLNEPMIDFVEPHERAHLSEAIAQVKKQKPVDVPVVIGKKETHNTHKIVRANPSDTAHTVANVSCATIEQANTAVDLAHESFSAWKATSVEDRCKLVETLSDLIRRDKYRLMAIEVVESGKTWAEADGDIAEAIDFCTYYAREMRKLSKPYKTAHLLGESNLMNYSPLGVSLVIAPWNFPLAILTGMVAASLVTGNTVVMKPAEQSSLIAFELMKLLKEAGCPQGVVNFIPGLGEEVGAHLVKHKLVRMVSFTGSREVGLKIVENSGVIPVDQRHVKKLIIEMGGKNAIIVDSDADLDEAIHGIVYSAFGFQGQKCSACSRAIVLEDNYDRFVERLVETTGSIFIGNAENPKSYLGPVVDEAAFSKISGIVARAKDYANLAYQGGAPEGGHYIAPTIFTNVDPNSEVAQAEIFGPVLAVIKVKNMDEALKVANDTDYALTGGVYSRSPLNIQKVKENLDVGNLYINRGITGAMVGRHPFGGHKLSGLGSKTGGIEYLKQYMVAQVITENTMRRGFAPIEE